jgi:hypothetical protein
MKESEEEYVFDKLYEVVYPFINEHIEDIIFYIEEDFNLSKTVATNLLAAYLENRKN